MKKPKTVVSTNLSWTAPDEEAVEKAAPVICDCGLWIQGSRGHKCDECSSRGYLPGEIVVPLDFTVSLKSHLIWRADPNTLVITTLEGDERVVDLPFPSGAVVDVKEEILFVETDMDEDLDAVVESPEWEADYPNQGYVRSAGTVQAGDWKLEDRWQTKCECEIKFPDHPKHCLMKTCLVIDTRPVKVEERVLMPEKDYEHGVVTQCLVIETRPVEEGAGRIWYLSPPPPSKGDNE